MCDYFGVPRLEQPTRGMKEMTLYFWLRITFAGNFWDDGICLPIKMFRGRNSFFPQHLLEQDCPSLQHRMKEKSSVQAHTASVWRERSNWNKISGVWVKLEPRSTQGNLILILNHASPWWNFTKKFCYMPCGDKCNAEWETAPNLQCIVYCTHHEGIWRDIWAAPCLHHADFAFHRNHWPSLSRRRTVMWSCSILVNIVKRIQFCADPGLSGAASSIRVRPFRSCQCHSTLKERRLNQTENLQNHTCRPS